MKTTKLFLFLCVFLSAHSNKVSGLNNFTGKIEIKETVPDSIYPPSDLVISYHTAWAKTHYPERITQFKSNPLENADIVFLGNSITELAGNWGSRFSSSIVKNRGIAGDVTEGVLARLGEIYYFKPTSVFLLIGINDIFAGKTPEFVAGNIIKITQNIHQRSPETKIYVQTILPNANTSIVSTIQATNKLLVSNASTNNYTLIDLHVLFADANDIIKPEYTTDGTHLTEVAYAVWINAEKSLIPSNLSSNLLTNADLQNGTASWIISGTADMFKIDAWSPSQPALKSFANNYWKPTYAVDGTIKQTVTGIANGSYIFSCQFAGATPISTSYSALIATDGNNVVTKKEFTMPSTWSVISMPIDITGGQVTVGFTIKDDVNSVFWFDAADFKLQTTTQNQTANIENKFSNYLTAFSNPFSNETTISFKLPNSEKKVKIEVFNIVGVLLQSFTENDVVANKLYSYTFDKSNKYNNQIFVARMFTSNKMLTTKFRKH